MRSINSNRPNANPQKAPSHRREEQFPTLKPVPPAPDAKATVRCAVCGQLKGSPDEPCPRCNGDVAVTWVRKMSDRGSRNWFTDLFAGGWLYLRGLGFMWAHRRLWLYVALPIFINVVLLVGIIVGGILLLHGPIQGIFAGEAWWQQAVEWTAEVLAILALLVVLFFLFTAVGTLIAAPFNDALSEKVERIVIGSAYEEPFSLRRDVAVPLVEALKLLLFQVVVMIALMVLWLIPVVGALPSVLAGMWFAALDFLDLPMERRRYSAAEKMRFMTRNKSLCLGFGAVCYLMLMIPFLQLLVIPVGVVGGTLMYLGAAEK